MIHPSTPGAGDREGGEPLAKTLGGASRQDASGVGYLTDLPVWIDGHISVTRKLIEKLLIPLVHAHGYVAAERELRGAVYALNRAVKALEARSAPEASSPKGPQP